MKLGDMVSLPDCECLNCHLAMKGSTALNEDGSTVMPDEGSITICSECGHIMAFGEGLKLRELSDEEMLEVAGDKRILIAQAALAEARKRRAAAKKQKKEKKEQPVLSPDDPFPVIDKHIMVETKVATAMLENRRTGEQKEGSSVAVLTIGGPTVTHEEAELICAWIKAQIVDKLDKQLVSDGNHFLMEEPEEEETEEVSTSGTFH